MLLLVLMAAYLTIDSLQIPANDPGRGDIAFFISPVLAGGAAFVVGLLLCLAAGVRLLQISVGSAAKALGVGCVGAPLVYLVLFVVGAAWLDEMGAGAISFFTYMVPAIIGIGLTLAFAFIRANRTSQR